jgi:hypothetical protein
MTTLEEVADMPCFVEPIMCPDDPETVTALDGWSVHPSGDEESDRATGELFAELAVKYARANDAPSFVSFVLATIQWKARDGLLMGDGMIEHGFYDRIARLACAGALN